MDSAVDSSVSLGHSQSAGSPLLSRAILTDSNPHIDRHDTVDGAVDGAVDCAIGNANAHPVTEQDPMSAYGFSREQTVFGFNESTTGSLSLSFSTDANSLGTSAAPLSHLAPFANLLEESSSDFPKDSQLPLSEESTNNILNVAPCPPESSFAAEKAFAYTDEHFGEEDFPDFTSSEFRFTNDSPRSSFNAGARLSMHVSFLYH